MATKRRPRKPLRSELSDGVRKNRRHRPIRTVPAQEAAQEVPKQIIEKPAEAAEDPVAVEEEIAIEPEVVREEEAALEEIDEDTKDPENVDDHSGLNDSSLLLSEDEEEKLRQRARDLGIKNWWNRKVESLLVEMEQLQGDE